MPPSQKTGGFADPCPFWQETVVMEYARTINAVMGDSRFMGLLRYAVSYCSLFLLLSVFFLLFGLDGLHVTCQVAHEGRLAVSNYLYFMVLVIERYCHKFGEIG